MPETEVINQRGTAGKKLVAKAKAEGRFVLIGRPSKWGNPFVIGRDGTREQVIAAYRVYIQTQPHLLAALTSLQGKVLACWCKPEACHGDVLAEMASD